jgi:23S rRNA (pseudouridine1915-N3)-methyltransferase
MRDEGAALLKKIPTESILIALDEKAAGFSSRALAGMLEKDRDEGARSLAFLVGGADGHGDDLLATAHRKLSLGQMTYPHGLARIILAEQLYRATTILSGHPYHRDGR